MNYLWENLFRRTKKEDEILSALKNNVLFNDLSDAEIRLLEGIVHVRQYHAGEPVFRQGEFGAGMYVIAKGRVDVYVDDTSAHAEGATREIFITQLVAGDFFGEVALVEDNGRRTASAIARDQSVLIGFFKPDLAEITRRSPASGLKILSRLAEVLGRRLKETTDKVSELRAAIRDLRQPPPPEL